MWIWKYQWALDALPNRVLTVFLFAWALLLAIKLGDSFAGVFNRRLDREFVGVLRKWRWQMGLARKMGLTV